MGHTADQLSLITAEQVEKEQMWFEEPIIDYIHMLAAVKEAIDKRQQLRKAYFMAVSDREAKAASWEKLKGIATTKEEKLQAAQDAFEAAETLEKDSATLFQEVSERALHEMDRFKETKADDMRKVVLDYVQLQIEYNKRMEQQWAALVPEIEAINIEPVRPTGVAQPNAVRTDRSPDSGILPNAGGDMPSDSVIPPPAKTADDSLGV